MMENSYTVLQKYYANILLCSLSLVMGVLLIT